MEGALGWIGELARFIGQFFPRLEIVKKTHGGVAFVRGKNVKEIRPGLYVWWPFWTECMFYPIVRQSLNLPPQTLTTNDDVSVSVSGVVIYKVDDIVCALSSQWDLNETIRDISMAAMREFICSSHFKTVNQNRKKMEEKWHKELQISLGAYGIEILDAKLTDFSRCRVLAVISSGQAEYLPIEDKDGDEE